MLTTIILLVLAINGGLYVGAILHSATEIARLDQMIAFYQRLWG